VHQQEVILMVEEAEEGDSLVEAVAREMEMVLVVGVVQVILTRRLLQEVLLQLEQVQRVELVELSTNK
jgi:hypothetical protein